MKLCALLNKLVATFNLVAINVSQKTVLRNIVKAKLKLQACGRKMTFNTLLKDNKRVLCSSRAQIYCRL